jgi:phosphohistidine phosphatase SixA
VAEDAIGWSEAAQTRLDGPGAPGLYFAMLRTLALLRHGRAAGQGPDAPLTPEGVQQLQRLASAMRAQGWRPEAILASPFVRAQESARTFAAGLGFTQPAIVLHELIPDSEPGDALQAIDAAAPGRASILVVSHLPLVARIASELTGEEVAFTPATLVEIADEGDGKARVVRRLTPDEL